MSPTKLFAGGFDDCLRLVCAQSAEGLGEESLELGFTSFPKEILKLSDSNTSRMRLGVLGFFRHLIDPSRIDVHIAIGVDEYDCHMRIEE